MNRLSAEAVFAALADQPGALWFDGGSGDEGWSVLAWSPEQVCTEGLDWPKVGRDLNRHCPRHADVPFAGGVAGYIGFGAGHHVAPVPAQVATPEPELWLGRYRGALCLRHADQRWFAVGEADVVAQGRAYLDQAVALAPPVEVAENVVAQTVSRARFEAQVTEILALIAAGDCYQINLTRPVHLHNAGDAWQAYRRLRAGSAPQFGAFLRLDADTAILSNSPELFLEVADGVAHSLPVKGTRPRGQTAREDQDLRQALLSASKDRAELTMIVDLVRNDLGRVAVPGTVQTSTRVVRTHANVHHASQSVRAQLESGTDAWDVLAMAFPPGSVTGAPKVRACERIGQLEDIGRGVYCGAIGFSGASQSRWSVAIRTAVFSGVEARYHVGGGIVSESTPADEWDETVAKGTELARALCGRRRL